MTKSILEIDKNGTKRYYNSQEQYHNENGPAVIYANGEMYWYINGLSHRIDGPADVYVDGRKSWCLKDNCVRRFKYD